MTAVEARAELHVCAVGVASLVAACAEDGADGIELPARDPELVAHLDEAFGLRLYRWSEPDAQLTRDPDGLLVASAVGDLS